MRARLPLMLALCFGIASLETIAASSESAVPAAVVRHGPNLNGGTVEGSIQVLLGEGFNVNSGFFMTDNFFVPGSPKLVFNGTVTRDGVIVGPGSAQPANYTVIFNGGVTFGYLVTRTDPVAIPSVPAVPNPAGTRSVNINQTGQSPGNFTTLRNLTLNSNVGVYDIPPGNYGNFIANSNTGFRLGIPGTTAPVVYNFQSLILNSNSAIEVLGPVVIRVRNSTHLNGTVGSSAHANIVWFELPSGGVTLNSGSRLHASVLAPAGQVIVNGNSILEGSLECDRFTLNSGGVLRLLSANSPPLADSQNLTVAFGDSLPITLTGSDPDGDALTFSIEASPANGTLSGTPPHVVYSPAAGFAGSDGFTFKVSDGIEDSASASISITIAPPPFEGEPDFYISNEGEVLAVAAPGVLANDAPGTPGTLTAVPGEYPAFGSLGLQTDGGFVYQPDAGFFGEDLFTYRPVSGAFAGELTPVSLYINARPRPVDKGYTVSQNAAVDVTLEAFDPDDAQVDFSLETSPTKGVLIGDVTEPSLRYLPNWQASGSDGFTFRVTDPLNASAIGSVSLVLAPANIHPVAVISVEGDATIPPYSMSFDGVGSYDPDGSVVLYEWDFDDDGVFEVQGPTAEFAAPEPGSVSVRLRVTDNSGAVAAASIDLFLNVPPRAQIVSPAAFTEFVEGDAIIVEALGADNDGNVVGLELLVNGEMHSSVSSPWAGFDLGGVPAGELSLVVRATDDQGALALSAEVPITIVPSLASSGKFVVHPNVRVAELPAVPGAAQGGTDEATTTLPLFADNFHADPVSYTVELLNDKTAGETEYIVLDSETSSDVSYVWEEISESGIKLEVSFYDDGNTEASMSFDFPFFGESFRTVYVGSNGVLSFVEDVVFGNNGPIPSVSEPPLLIAPFWTDLVPGVQFDDNYGGFLVNASAVYAKDFGDRFVVQYSADADFWGPLGDEMDFVSPENNADLGIPNFNRTGRYTFQVILHQSGDIDFVYRWMGGDVEAATIGVQNIDGTDGLQLAFNQPFLTNHRTIRLKRELRGAPWFTLDDVGGSLAAGERDEMTVRFHSGPDFPTGVYSGQVRVEHDQPGADPFLVDVGLNIFPLDPAVAFVNPDPRGRRYFFAGETIPIQVAASDEDGLVRFVWVTVDDVELASWLSGPYGFEWNPAVGEYTLVAYALDNDGRVSASEPMHISVSVDIDGNRLPDRFEIDFFDGVYGIDALYDWDADGLTVRKELWLGLSPVAADAIDVPNLAPVARLTTQRLSGEAPFVVTFDASASHDQDGAVVEWFWDFDGNGSIDSTAQQAQWTFPQAGEFPVTLLIFDDEGEPATATVTIRVRPSGTTQTPIASFEASLYAAPAARNVYFDATASVDPDGAIESYEWRFGDGTTATGPMAEHYFDRVGIHPVRLTVTDEDGLTATIEKFITVTHADRGVFEERNGFLVLQAEHATTFDPRNDRFAWRLSRSRITAGDWGAHLEYAGDDLRSDPPDTGIEWVDAAEIAWRVRINNPGLYYYAARYTTGLHDPFGNLHWRVGLDGVETGPPNGDPIGHSESAIRWRRGVPLGFLDRGEHTIQIRRAGDLVWLDQIVVALDKDALPADQTTSPGLLGSVRDNLPVAPPTARIEAATVSNQLPIEVVLDGGSSTATRGAIAGYNWTINRGTDPTTGLPRDRHASFETSQTVAFEIDDFNHPGDRGDAFGPDGVEVGLTVVDSFGQIGEALRYFPVVDPLESITGPVDIVVDDSSPGFSAGLRWRVSGQQNDFIHGNYYPGGVDEFFAQLNQTPPAFGAIPVDRLELREWYGPQARFNFTDHLDSASFAPELPAAADYMVFVRWPRTDRALEPYVDPISGETVGIAVDEAAVVSVNGSTGSGDYVMNQRLGGGHWRFVGIHRFDAGTGGTVSIQPSEDQTVTFADAVRFLQTTSDPGNETPMADFSFGTQAGGTVSFDGSTSFDPDGDIIAWFWEFGDGATSRARRPNHFFAQPGDYAVTLTVIDDQLGFHKVTRSVNIQAQGVNETPIARIRLNATRGEAPFVLQMDGSLSTDDGSVLSHRWKTVLEDEPWGGITPFAADGALASFVFNKPGLYPITLIVTDDEGATDSASIIIETLPRGVATAAPHVVDNRDRAVTFNGAWGTFNPSIRQQWPVSLGEQPLGLAGSMSGPDFAYATQAGDVAVFKPSLPHAGMYQVFMRYPLASPITPLGVRIRHAGGESSVDYNHGVHAGDWQLLGTFLFGGGSQSSVSFARDGSEQDVFADAVRWVPVGGGTNANFTYAFPSGSIAPATVNFDGTATTSDGGVVSYDWDFGDGTVGQGAAIAHTYANGGTFVVTLSVADDGGAISTASRFVRVDATLTPPIAVANVVPLSGNRPLVVGFDGSASSDPDGVAAFHWDFGDGQNFSGVAGSHRYDQPGTYQITLTVTDGQGASSQVVQSVQVNSVSSHPTVRLEVDPFDLSAGIIQFNAGDVPADAVVTWNFGDGQSGTGSSVLYDYAAPGAYLVVLAVDVDGQVTTVGRWISVGESQAPPDAPRNDPGAAFILYTPLAPIP